VNSELAGTKVQLRYDPFDLSVIQVWKDDKRWNDARTIDLTRRHDRCFRFLGRFPWVHIYHDFRRNRMDGIVSALGTILSRSATTSFGIK